jgi:ribosomal protein S4
MNDIWGVSFTYKKPTREVKFVKMLEQEQAFRRWYYRKEFVYSFKKRIRFRRAKKSKDDFLFPRFLKHFYLILKLSDFRKMQKKATKKGDNFEPTYITLLECRLFMIVFRVHWITNIFMIRSMVDNGMFTINGETRRHSNIVAKVGDIIGVHQSFIDLVRYDVLLRYINNIIFWNTPDFMFLNYSFMISIFWREPMDEDLEFFTDEIDIYFGSEYYFPSPS